MKYRLLLPLTIVILMIVACAPAPDLRNDAFLDDTSLISGEPCEAPCWQNLMPGETVWGVAQDTFAVNEDFRQLNDEGNRRTPEDWIDFAFRDGPTCCRIYSVDGEILTSMLLLVAPQMTLGQVLERHGEPTYITAEAKTADQAIVQLFFPNTPMIVFVFAETISSDFTSNNEVFGMVYMAASEMENHLLTENLYNWNGYGALADVIDGEFDLTPIPQTADQ